MSPVDGTQAMMQAGVPPPPPIPLSTLIDFIIQRTYHELTILSELLPRKSDMERKIEIVQFANRTRQLFVRLLALVKWANSAGKVDKCAMISSFLDQQAMRFVETADLMARLSRDTLVHARLPSFSLPCAVDVLTTGTYSRLPAIIKDSIVPPDRITPLEKRQTLMRLNQIIEHRLVMSPLPPRMQRLRIENGRVKFYVEHEFEVKLTVMGDGVAIPWRLLDIEIIVEDPETGDGKALVHSLQVRYIHELVQLKLNESEQPLHDLYNILHSFCQSLQLEVLHSQAQRLIRERLGDHVRVEEYTPGKCLSVSYWRDQARRAGSFFPSTNYKLSIHVDENDASRPLQISHQPQIHGSESTKVAMAIRSDHLSIEKLLMHTVQVRSMAKLKDLERELRCIIPGPCEIQDLPALLYVPILYPCMVSEKLCVAVDIQKGTFLLSLAEKETELTEDIEDCLNADHRDLRKLLTRLRLWLGLQRCQSSVQHMAAVCQETLPLVETAQHPLENLSRHKLFIRLPKQSSYYLIVEVYERDRSVGYNHFLLEVLPSTHDALMSDALDEIPQVYLKPGHLLQLDTFICTHGMGAQLYTSDPDSHPHSKKRKLLLGNAEEPPSKKPATAPYMVPELSHILANCEDRIPFLLLATELQKQGITHQGIQVDGAGAGLALTLIDVPPCPDVDPAILEKLKNDLLSCKFRLQKKGGRIWMVESIFTNCPIKSTNLKEQGNIHRIYFSYNNEKSGVDCMAKVVQSFIDDWNNLAHHYEIVTKFTDIYNVSTYLQRELEVKTYTYKRITLAYGHNNCFTVSIQYKSAEQQFHLSFGTAQQTPLANCHTLMATQLQRLLNNTKSIAQLAQVLLDTWAPLSALGKVTAAPMMGAGTKPNQPLPTFNIIPQSPTHIRLVYKSLYCIDIHCRGNQIAAVRDGAYSMFDTSKVVEGLTPIPGLRAFLNQFVDDTLTMSQSRRRSTTEDDNPPSPVGMDTMDSFMSQSANIGSPASRQKDSLRFHNPMTPPSNPHTPASPSTRMTVGVAPSPSTALMGTPSPGTVLAQGSPSNPSLHVPSPNSFVPAPSPQSLGIHMPSPATQFISPQGMVEGGSPFPNTSNLAMPSPGARNWPGSPSVPGPSPASRHIAHSPGSVLSPPSRILPQRSWAAAIPTLLSHDALNKLLTPAAPPPNSQGQAQPVICCPLETFLGCAFLTRHFRRVLSGEENLQTLPSNEPGVMVFKAETFQCRISLSTPHLQSLTLKLVAMQDNQWEADELQVLEHFFESKVAGYPFKTNTTTAFVRLLGAPIRVLKDFIQIMRLELVPDTNMKWQVHWCLTVPNTAPPIVAAGTPAVIIKGKMLFMLQIRRIGVPVPAGTEAQTVILPVLYDMLTNSTSLADRVQSHSTQYSQAHHAVTNMLKRFQEFNPEQNRCSIYPCIRELLCNLVVPV